MTWSSQTSNHSSILDLHVVSRYHGSIDLPQDRATLRLFLIVRAWAMFLAPDGLLMPYTKRQMWAPYMVGNVCGSSRGSTEQMLHHSDEPQPGSVIHSRLEIIQSVGNYETSKVEGRSAESHLPLYFPFQRL